MAGPASLTHPAGLLLLALLGPLFTLYFLRAKRTPRLVSSVWLFREARRDLRAERRLRRLLPVVPLFIETAAIVALALAAAEPARRGSVATTDDIAIVVDTSRSMGAKEGARSRLDLAKAAAKALGRELDGRGAVVVEAAKEPRVAAGVERDPERLAAILDALAPRDEPADLTAAVLLAEERLATLPGSHRIVVVTDVNGELPPRGRLPRQVVRVGVPTDNVSLARIELRRTARPGSTRDRVDALAVVQSFAEVPAERFVSLSRRGVPSPIASRRVTLAPHERTTVVLSFDADDTDSFAGVVAELSPGDALDGDDRAFVLIPPGPRLPVVIAPLGVDPWLSRALAADPGVDLREAPLPLREDAVPAGGLLVTVGACADAPRGGDVLAVAPPEGDCLGTRIGPVVKAPAITSWSDGDPRLRFVSFDDVHVLEGRPVEAPRAATLLRAGETTLIADLGLFGRSGTVVGFDWSKSDWPLRASFVLFVRNVTELAREDRSRGLGGASLAGEPLRIAAPVPPRTSILLRGPDGEVPARLVGGLVAGEAPGRAGFYDVLAGGRLVATAAVNGADDGEDDLRHVPTTMDASGKPEAATSAVPTFSSLSPWFAAAALVCAALEMAWLFRRGTPRRSSKTASSPNPARAVVRGTILTIAVVASASAVLSFWLRSRHAASGVLGVDRPGWTLAAAALIFALLFVSERARTGGVRRALVEGLLALSGLAIALSAAGVVLRSGLDKLSVIVAVDRSRSMDLVPNAVARVDRALADASRGMRKDDRLGVVAFASEAALEEPLHGRNEPRSPQRVPLARDATDLAAGIRRALSETPLDAAARIVVASDGVATRGDTVAAAAAAALAAVPVDVLVLEQTARPSIRAQALRAPARANAGETMDLRLTVRSTTDADVDVVLQIDGERRQAGRARVHAGEDVLFVRAHADTSGLHEYAVRVQPVDPATDTVAEDNVQSAFVRVAGRAQALVIDEDEGRAAPIVKALESAAFDVAFASATRAPVAANELLRHDLVVLGNVPARDFSAEQLDAIAAYVEHLGGGLLLFGGRRAMGPGGYAGTPVERVSPVSFELRRELRRSRLAEVIAIDYSGSMAMTAGNHTKLELANEAAVRSGDLLSSVDRLGVVHVDTTPSWTVPLAPLTDKLGLGRRVRAVGPGGGGIFVDAALEAAYAALERETVEQKHVLLFADGDDAEERQAAPSLARAARSRGITTSVVALGHGRDTGGLERVSREGEGRFYLLEDAGRLPAVFAEETTIAAGSALHDEPFRAVPGVPIAATRDVDLGSAPPLGGYVIATARARAEVALFAAEQQPLLATWAAGTGHAGAFTSDYAEPWGTDWRAWPGAARLFAQLGRSLARGDDDPTVTLDASITGGQLRVAANALADDGSRNASRSLTANVVGPAGFERAVRLSPKSPGSYEALVPVTLPGTYVAEVVDDATHTATGTAGAVLSSGDELEPSGTDRALLERLARVTGGRVRTSLAGIFAERPEARRGFRPLSPWLAAVGALAMLLSAAARRLPALVRSPRRAVATEAASSSKTATPHAAPAAVTESDVSPTTGPPMAPPKSKETSGVEGASATVPAPTTAELLLERRRRRR